MCFIICRKLLTNPKTGVYYKAGDSLKRPILARTLEHIAEKGPDALYKGCLTEGFVKDVSAHGGIITKKDLNMYRYLPQKGTIIFLWYSWFITSHRLVIIDFDLL